MTGDEDFCMVTEDELKRHNEQQRQANASKKPLKMKNLIDFSECDTEVPTGSQKVSLLWSPLAKAA